MYQTVALEQDPWKFQEYLEVFDQRAPYTFELLTSNPELADKQEKNMNSLSSLSYVHFLKTIV